MLARYLLHSGIGDTYGRLSWEDATDIEPGAAKVLDDYQTNAEAYLNAGIGMVLTGPNGCGKTLMAVLLLKHLLGKGHGGFFTPFSSMLDMFTASWRSEDEKRWFQRQVRNAALLVIDDVGKEFHQRQVTKGEGHSLHVSQLAETAFDEVLRYRVQHAKSTLITTNKSVAELGREYGQSLLSLLMEGSIVHNLSGSDFRFSTNSRRIEWAKMGLRAPLVVE